MVINYVAGQDGRQFFVVTAVRIEERVKGWRQEGAGEELGHCGLAD